MKTGGGTRIRSLNRRTAWVSRSKGRFVAAKTKTAVVHAAIPSGKGYAPLCKWKQKGETAFKTEPRFFENVADAVQAFTKFCGPCKTLLPASSQLVVENLYERAEVDPDDL